jgi:hypothetical protein
MPILLLTVHLLTVILTKKAHEFSDKADAAKKLIFIYFKTHSHVLFVCTLQTRNLIEIVSFPSIYMYSYTRMSILYCFQTRNYLETCVQHGTLSFCLTKRKDFAATVNNEKTNTSTLRNPKNIVCVFEPILVQ